MNLFAHSQRRQFLKAVSLSVTAALLQTSIVSPAEASALAKASSPQADARQTFGDRPAGESRKAEARQEAARVELLTPPSELGTVVDAHMTSNNLDSPLVVHIQDLHANYEVQAKIAKLLEFYDSHLPSYQVAVEGAQGPVLVSELAKLPDPAFKAEVGEKLLKAAELTGTEYFAIVHGKPDLLWGVEDERYHQANVELFQQTYQGKQELARSLGSLEKDLLPIKEKFYTRAQKKLDRKAADYASGKLDLADYTLYLVRQAEKQGINVAARYPEIAKWSGNAPPSARPALGEVRLRRLAFGGQPEKYADADKLMTEQADLYKEVQAGLAKTDLQRNLAGAAGGLDLLKRLMSEELTTEEVRYLAPQLAQLGGQVQRLLDATGLPYDKKGLGETLSASLDFYTLALLRDKFLADNALQLLRAPGSGLRNQKGLRSPEPRAQSRPQNDVVVLVTGGFHTPGITKILKEKGVSYITVAPTVSAQTDHDKQLYVARLLNRHFSPENILNGNSALMPPVNGPMATVAIETTAIASVERFGPNSARESWGRASSQLGKWFKKFGKRLLAPLANKRGAAGSKVFQKPLIQAILDDAQEMINSGEYKKADELLTALIHDLQLAQSQISTSLGTFGNVLVIQKSWHDKYPTSDISESFMGNYINWIKAASTLQQQIQSKLAQPPAAAAPTPDTLIHSALDEALAEIKTNTGQGYTRAGERLNKFIKALDKGANPKVRQTALFLREVAHKGMNGYFRSPEHVSDYLHDPKNLVSLSGIDLEPPSQPSAAGAEPTAAAPAESDAASVVNKPELKVIEGGASPEREKLYRDVIQLVQADIGKWLGDMSTLPPEVLQAAEDVLNEELAKDNQSILVDYVLHSSGPDLILQLNTTRRSTFDPQVNRLALKAVTAAIAAGRDKLHAYEAINRKDYFKMTPLEQARSLSIRPLAYPYTERSKTDPVSVVLTQNMGVGSMNSIIYDQYFNPNKSSFGSIEGGSFYAVVENIEDVRNGLPKEKRRIRVLGNPPFDVEKQRAFTGEITMVRGNNLEPIRINAEDIGNRDQLLTLMGDPTEWVVTDVYAASGRFFDDKTSRAQPVASVSFERVLSDREWHIQNPILVGRLQSGAPAVGEVHRPAIDAHLVPGGEDDGRYVAMIPVSLEDFAKGEPDKNYAKVAVYSYQSTMEGMVPRVKDLFAQDTNETRRARERMLKWYREALKMLSLGIFVEPLVTTVKAERVAIAEHQRSKSDFEHIPNTKLTAQIETLIRKLQSNVPYDELLAQKDELDEKGKKTGQKYWVAADLTGDESVAKDIAKEILLAKEGQGSNDGIVASLRNLREHDPLLEEADKWSGGRTFRINKADVGGEPGHTTPPPYTMPAFRASNKERREVGLLEDSRAFSVGDDSENGAVDQKGLDNSEVHQAFYETYFRAAWVAEVLGERVYGHLQDLVGPTSEGKPTAQMANLTPRFIELLKKELAEEMNRNSKFRKDFNTRGRRTAQKALRKLGILAPDAKLANTLDAFDLAFRAWQDTKTANKLETPTVGNTTGEGPGAAETNLPVGKNVQIVQIAGDKDGPAAFNAIFLYLLKIGLPQGFFDEWNGAIVEIWDIEKHQRIFLDPSNPWHMKRIENLLMAVNKYNVKRLWAKKSRDVLTGSRIKDNIAPIIISAASTDKLSEITGGEYRGKDDATAVFYAKLGFLANEFIKTIGFPTQGDARGSHNMWLRPSSLEEAVATINSRGVVTSLLYQVVQNPETGRNEIIQMRDLYADGSWDEAKGRYDELNEAVWNWQGPVGFVRVSAKSTEKSYPLQRSLNLITAEDSRLGHLVTSGTEEAWEQATTQAAANKPWRSVAAALGGLAVAAILPVMVLPGALFAAYHGFGFVQGIFVTKGKFTAPAAIHTKAEKALLLLQGEEIAHNLVRFVLRLSPDHAFASPGARAADEVVSMLTSPFLFAIGLPVMAAKAILNLFISSGKPSYNTSLYHALEDIADAAKSVALAGVKTVSAAAVAIARRSGVSPEELRRKHAELMAKRAVRGAA